MINSNLKSINLIVLNFLTLPLSLYSDQMTIPSITKDKLTHKLKIEYLETIH